MRIALLICCVSAAAVADDNDLQLWKLGHPDPINCTRCDGSAGDTGEPGDPNAQARFHRLASTLGLAFAPPFQETAGTLGQSGFEVGVSSSEAFLRISGDAWPTRTSGPPKVLAMPTVTLSKGVGALSMWKDARSAEATKCGVWGALLARGGMTGPPQPFEGRGGLWSRNGPTREFTLPVQEKLAIERNWFKLRPAEDSSQGTLELIPEMRTWTKTDEIASIQMAVGAANAGARASTSTSGPGFALMVEGIAYASMTEVGGPVIFLWQRGGPSTGLPTRQDQSDLQFTLHPAHGEFPHMVVAPATCQQIFDDSFEAFNWADKYQMPVGVIVV